ncbi:unnamed protein product [Ectocarpus sp. CCAP 1310/34]|nr:unnamed protein product [Ectocarpus sp. CCAP 1310/34]
MVSDLEAAAVGEPVPPFPVTSTRSVNPRLAKVFRRQDGETQEAAFIAYLTAGYPKKTDTVELLLALQEGGVDVVELGVPFGDPQAGGPTIQATKQVHVSGGLAERRHPNGMSRNSRDARAKGLTIVVVLMGYLNPFLAYGLNKLAHKLIGTDRLPRPIVTSDSVDGFLAIDLPPDDAHNFSSKCYKHHLSFIPLVTPTTTDNRLPFVASATDSFVYCGNVTGVTGARAHLPTGVEKFIRRVRRVTGQPLFVGFGISLTEQVQAVARIADGVVVGWAFMNAIDEGDLAEPSYSAAEPTGCQGGEYNAPYPLELFVVRARPAAVRPKTLLGRRCWWGYQLASDAPASEIAAHLRKDISGLRVGVVAAAAAAATTTIATSVKSKTPSKQAYRMPIEGAGKAVLPGGNIGAFGGC